MTSLKLPDLPLNSNAVLVFGGGGHGKTLVELIKACGTHPVAGVIDDHLQPGTLIAGVPVLGGEAVLSACFDQGIKLAVNGVGGIGNVDVRLKVFDTLASHSFTCLTVVHPTAWVETSALLEAGVQVLAHSYVGSDCRVGFGSVLNVGTCLSHDVIVGRVTNFSPGAQLAGNVTVGDYTQVGMNATINLKIKVGSRVRIGNGATVKADVPDAAIVRAGSIFPLPQPK